MKPRIAVLGCGYWGSNHIRTLKALGALHAVSDANRARAEGFASEQGCLAVDPEALFDRDDIDGIVMALPPQFHADAAVRAVEAAPGAPAWIGEGRFAILADGVVAVSDGTELSPPWRLRALAERAP